MELIINGCKLEVIPVCSLADWEVFWHRKVLSDAKNDYFDRLIFKHKGLVGYARVSEDWYMDGIDMDDDSNYRVTPEVHKVICDKLAEIYK